MSKSASHRDHLLNLVFHRLYYKQGDDETMTLDMDELLKEVKKRDKDLGS